MNSWRFLAVGMLLAAASCSSGANAKVRHTLTQRQRDSILRSVRIPGVAGALKVSDSAAARRRLEDSIAKAP